MKQGNKGKLNESQGLILNGQDQGKNNNMLKKQTNH